MAALRFAKIETKMRQGWKTTQTMLLTHDRQKLINAIIFFGRESRYLGKIKLFKLLYFLDFQHFMETGRSVTGLDYYAWPMGPVPVSLFEEVEHPERDMAGKVQFSERSVRDGTMLTITPLVPFDPSYFSKRELRILRQLAEEFRDARADDMVEASHLENLPWHKVYVEEGKGQQLIPYRYALRRQELEDMNDVIDERDEFIDYFRER
jgi:uncharacterized phage-associated protein